MAARRVIIALSDRVCASDDGEFYLPELVLER